MSHQDRMSDIVINHQTIKQVVDWLLPPALFVGMKVRRGATWLPRTLAVTALIWATLGLENLTACFEQARKITKKIFRWQPEPGATYQGFMKVLAKWHVELMLAITPHIQAKMRETLPGQWEIAGYVVFAGDGSRVEVARTKSLEQAFSPKSSRKAKGKGKKKQAAAPGERRSAGGRNRRSNRPLP